MTENDISYKIRGAIFKVHKALGPGLLESVYEAALAHELSKAGLRVRRQVNDLVIIEIKSIEDFS